MMIILTITLPTSIIILMKGRCLREGSVTCLSTPGDLLSDRGLIRWGRSGRIVLHMNSRCLPSPLLELAAFFLIHLHIQRGHTVLLLVLVVERHLILAWPVVAIEILPLECVDRVRNILEYRGLFCKCGAILNLVDFRGAAASTHLFLFLPIHLNY